MEKFVDEQVSVEMMPVLISSINHASKSRQFSFFTVLVQKLIMKATLSGWLTDGK